MRVVSRLRLEPPREALGSWWPARPARIALVDDEGDEMDWIPLTELRDALNRLPHEPKE